MSARAIFGLGLVASILSPVFAFADEVAFDAVSAKAGPSPRSTSGTSPTGRVIFTPERASIFQADAISAADGITQIIKARPARQEAGCESITTPYDCIKNTQCQWQNNQCVTAPLPSTIDCSEFSYAQCITHTECRWDFDHCVDRRKLDADSKSEYKDDFVAKQKWDEAASELYKVADHINAAIDQAVSNPSGALQQYTYACSNLAIVLSLANQARFAASQPVVGLYTPNDHELWKLVTHVMESRVTYGCP